MAGREPAGVTMASSSGTLHPVQGRGRIASAPIRGRLYPVQDPRRSYIAASIPAGRIGEAAEVAALIAFPVSGRPPP